MRLLPDPPRTTESAPSVNHLEGSSAFRRTDSAGLGTTTPPAPAAPASQGRGIRTSVNVDADAGKTTRGSEGGGKEPEGEGEATGEGNSSRNRVPQRAGCTRGGGEGENGGNGRKEESGGRREEGGAGRRVGAENSRQRHPAATFFLCCLLHRWGAAPHRDKEAFCRAMRRTLLIHAADAEDGKWPPPPQHEQPGAQGPVSHPTSASPCPPA